MQYTTPDGKFLREAFDSISPNYDRLNQILSFGMSEAWRERSAEIVLKTPGFSPQSILDLGCGTGKFLECFLKARPWEYAVGLDFSSAMLKKARETVSERVLWIEEDFADPPFLESSFDLVISGFTLRSVGKLPEFLGQVFRILKPKGRAVFLDLTRPRNLMARLMFFPYLRWFLPLIGWLISGNIAAYKFLSQSVRDFQTPEKTLEHMKLAGFTDLATKSFAFGAATLIIGRK